MLPVLGSYPLRVSLVAALLTAASAQHRLRLALRARHEIIPCEDWTAVLLACAERPIRAVVVDLYATGTPELERLRQLRARYPRTTIILYVTMARGRAVELFDAARIGADALVVMDENDSPGTLLGVLERAESKSLAGLITRSLSQSTDPLVRETLLLAVARVHEHLTGAVLARLLAVRTSTLRDRLAESGFPPARRLITWARLIAAAYGLEDRTRSADRVAGMHGFASGSAFRNICQRYLHATPSEIRARGGADYALRCLLRQVQNGSATKAPGRASRSPVVIF